MLPQRLHSSARTNKALEHSNLTHAGMSQKVAPFQKGRSGRKRQVVDTSYVLRPPLTLLKNAATVAHTSDSLRQVVARSETSFLFQIRFFSVRDIPEHFSNLFVGLTLDALVSLS